MRIHSALHSTGTHVYLPLLISHDDPKVFLVGSETCSSSMPPRPNSPFSVEPQHNILPPKLKNLSATMLGLICPDRGEVTYNSYR